MMKKIKIGKVKRRKGYFAYVDGQGNVFEFKPKRGRKRRKRR